MSTIIPLHTQHDYGAHPPQTDSQSNAEIQEHEDDADTGEGETMLTDLGHHVDIDTSFHFNLRPHVLGVLGVIISVSCIIVSTTLTLLQFQGPKVNGQQVPPHISETAIFSPQSEIFAMIGVACCLFVFALKPLAYSRRKMAGHIEGTQLQSTSVTCCCGFVSLSSTAKFFDYSGMITCFGLFLLTSISLRVQTTIHLIGTFSFFIALIVMMYCDIVLVNRGCWFLNRATHHDSGDTRKDRFWALWKKALFTIELVSFIVPQIVSFILVLTGGVTMSQDSMHTRSGPLLLEYAYLGAISQYVMIATAWLYVVSFYSELKTIRLTAHFGEDP